VSDWINIHLTNAGPEMPYPPEEIFSAVETTLRAFMFENISHELIDKVHEAVEQAIEMMLPKIRRRYEVHCTVLPDRNRISLSFAERSAVDQLADLADG